MKSTNKNTISVTAWRKARRAEGWRDIAMLLPPEVKPLVIGYKNKLMKVYHKTKLTEKSS